MDNRVSYEPENLSGAVQHNLRTPLAVLIGYTELAVEELEEHESRIELAEVISNLQNSLKSCFELNAEISRLASFIDSQDNKGGEGG